MIFSDLASNAGLLPALPALPACNSARSRHRDPVFRIAPEGVPTIPQCRQRAGRKALHQRPPQAERDNWGACQPPPP
jgi:hypothetical protein